MTRTASPPTSNLRSSRRFTLTYQRGKTINTDLKRVKVSLFLRNVEVEASEVDAVIEYMEKVAARQNGMVNPANFRAPDCPKL